MIEAKTLNPKSADILLKLLAFKRFRIDNANECFMPVYVETLELSDEFRVILLAHYGDQWGELVRRPEMRFFQKGDTPEFIPYSYRNDDTGIRTCSVRFNGNGLEIIDPLLQADHACFADIWLAKIATQQNLL